MDCYALLAKDFTSSQFMCISPSVFDQGPPVQSPWQIFPQPIVEASVSILRCGSLCRRHGPFCVVRSLRCHGHQFSSSIGRWFPPPLQGSQEALLQVSEKQWRWRDCLCSLPACSGSLSTPLWSDAESTMKSRINGCCADSSSTGAASCSLKPSPSVRSLLLLLEAFSVMGSNTRYPFSTFPYPSRMNFQVLKSSFPLSSLGMCT